MALQGDMIELMRHFMGQHGANVIIDTTAVSGDWHSVLCLSDTAFATGTTYNGATNPFGATTVVGGTRIPGIWTDLELASGAVVAFSFVEYS